MGDSDRTYWPSGGIVALAGGTVGLGAGRATGPAAATRAGRVRSRNASTSAHPISTIGVGVDDGVGVGGSVGSGVAVATAAVPAAGVDGDGRTFSGNSLAHEVIIAAANAEETSAS